MSIRFTTTSAEDTRCLGERIGQCLIPGDLLLMYGDLGAGKTTLAQGIARGMGISEDEYVRSPTFTLINQYLGKIPLNHIDLYRLDDSHAIEQLGLEEVITEDNVTLIEWAEKLDQFSSQDAQSLTTHSSWKIQLDSPTETTRNIEIIPFAEVPQGHLLLTLQ